MLLVRTPDSHESPTVYGSICIFVIAVKCRLLMVVIRGCGSGQIESGLDTRKLDAELILS